MSDEALAAFRRDIVRKQQFDLVRLHVWSATKILLVVAFAVAMYWVHS
ncbi:hypothetical protein Pan1_77 [Pseudanabaena phage Pan1]|nr:hypothetical protein Pan1_77 [Pseudanabaena phage Pan1]